MLWWFSSAPCWGPQPSSIVRTCLRLVPGLAVNRAGRRTGPRLYHFFGPRHAARRILRPMPRKRCCILPGVACHIKQRGVDLVAESLLRLRAERGPSLAYGERNPVRAGMVVQAAGAIQRKRFRFADYRWSSAKAHFSGKDDLGTLDTWVSSMTGGGGREPGIGTTSCAARTASVAARYRDAPIQASRLATRSLSRIWRSDLVVAGFADGRRRKRLRLRPENEEISLHCSKARPDERK